MKSRMDRIASMKHALALLVSACMLSAAAANAQVASPHAIGIPRWFVESFLDFREDIADARKDGKRLLVYFGQDGCPYCKLLMQTTFTETRIVDKTRKGFMPIALNLWGDREVTWIDGRRMPEKELGRLLQVQFTPTLLFFDEKANVVVRLNGYQPPHRMEAALDYVAGRMEAKQPFADYMQRAAREAASPQLNNEPFFVRPPYDLWRGSRPLLVVFERPHCASCDELHREGFRRKEVTALISRLTVARFDPASDVELTAPDGRRTTASDWARELKIAFAPTLVFFDRGAEVFRVEAYVRPFHLASALEYVESGAYRSEPSFQRFVQARADRMRARGETVDLWK
jgi:thioredoxin-related protein